jgi:hypothetical protein
MFKHFYQSLVSIFAIFSIEGLNIIDIPEIMKFTGQTIIGILTVIFLYLQIDKLVKERRKNTSKTWVKSKKL